jgi:integrase
LRGHVASKNRKDKRKGPFYLVVNGKWYSGQAIQGRPFATKKEAHAALADLLSRIAKNEHVEPSRQTVSEYLDKWLAGVQGELKASTFDSYSRTIEKHIRPRLGDLKLQRITRTDVKSLKAAMEASKLSGRSIEYALAVLKKALSDAVDDGLMGRNPAQGVKPPKNEKPELEVWSPVQLRAFLDAVRDHPWFPLWTVLGTCGLRRGEALGLRWRDVEWEPPRMWVRRSLVTVGSRTEFTTPKNDHVRSVDLDPFTTSVLREHRALTELVFCQPNGNPLDPSKVSKEFRRLAILAGLPPIRLHDLRHSHTTHLLQNGVPVNTVAARLGHADPGFTLRVYGHLLDDSGSQAAKRIGEVVFG